MKIEILGAGGAIPVPRPFCPCAVCEEARQKGAPYTRLGPSLFIHDIGLLFDTPEEIAFQLNRARIMHVTAVTYSHWHPDHTAGIRVWEGNYNVARHFAYPPIIRCTQMYLPENVAKTFEKYHDLAAKVQYAERLGIVARQVVPEGGSFALDGVNVTPFALADPIACGFVIDWQDGHNTARRALICMDETFGWTPPAWLGRLDVAILPAGIFEFHPLTGERHIPAAHPILKREATYAQTLDMIRKMDAERIVFIHLSEGDGLSYDEFRAVARQMRTDATLPPAEFAYDTMIIEV